MTVILTRHGWSTALHMTGVYGLLAVCARRKQGAPQGSVLSPAQTPERGLGRGVGAKGRASESGKTIPRDLQTAKSNTATRKPWPASSGNN